MMRCSSSSSISIRHSLVAYGNVSSAAIVHLAIVTLTSALAGGASLAIKMLLSCWLHDFSHAAQFYAWLTWNVVEISISVAVATSYYPLSVYAALSSILRQWTTETSLTEFLTFSSVTFFAVMAGNPELHRPRNSLFIGLCLNLSVIKNTGEIHSKQAQKRNIDLLRVPDFSFMRRTCITAAGCALVCLFQATK